MEFVNPIKDLNKIEQIKNLLYSKSKRDYLFFVLGINTGMRLNELLSLKINDIFEDKKAKDFLCIKDEKSGDIQAIYLNNKVRSALISYLNSVDFKDSDYLFKSKKDNKPITRQQAYRIINNAAKEAGIEEKIGTHTLRKTFGFHAYQKGIAISFIKNRFNHTTTAETLRYINVENKEDKLIKLDVNL